METGIVTLLAVAALGSGAPADLAAAIAAALRPELAPWSACVRAGLSWQSGASVGRVFTSIGAVAAAVAIVAMLRAWLFGRAAPLAVFAKPSDLEHGARYAVYAVVQTGLPLLVCAPFSLRRGAPIARVLAISGLVHFTALALAGGDWMSLYRLAVPVLPSFGLAGAELWQVSPPWASWTRAAGAAAMSAYVTSALAPSARKVGPARVALIEQARPVLSGARSVAALDVGWVGAVGDFDVVDLAGVTDETIAMLPGGHTSKRVSDALLRSRAVDAFVLLEAPPPDVGYAREVERRVALTETASHFRVAARLPLGNTNQTYVVLRKP
jgi:hypothetical protein